MKAINESKVLINKVEDIPFECTEVNTGRLRLIREKLLGARAVLNIIHSHLDNNPDTDGDTLYSIKLISRVTNSINCEISQMIGDNDE